MGFDLSALASPTFNWRLGHAAIQASTLAYQSHGAITDQLKAWGFATSGITALANKNIHGFTAKTDGAMLVAIRGSDDSADWKLSFDKSLASVPQLGGKAHLGFIKGYNLIAQQIADSLSGAGDRQIWFTGHSLGGAIGLLAFASLRSHFPKARLVTFGQPAMMDKAAARWVADTFRHDYTRIVNDRDIVATLLSPGLWHSGAKLHFNAEGRLQTPDEAKSTIAAPRTSPLDILRRSKLRFIVNTTAPGSLTAKLSGIEAVAHHNRGVYEAVVAGMVQGAGGQPGSG